MYCTGQTPPSILNAFFGFFALVRIFSLLSFLSWVRNWICWFVLFFFFYIRPRRVLSLERKKENTCMKDGFALVGFLVWSSWGVFVFYYCTVYTLLYNKYILSVPLSEQSSYLVFFIYLRAYGLSPPMQSFYPHLLSWNGTCWYGLHFCDSLLFGTNMRGRSVVMCWLILFVIFFWRWGLGGESSIRRRGFWGLAWFDCKRLLGSIGD